MSIVISGIRLPFESSETEAEEAALTLLPGAVGQTQAIKLSFDLRRGKLEKVWSVRLDSENESWILERYGGSQVKACAPADRPMPSGSQRFIHAPVIVGFGPAGMFAALLLAQNGYRPMVLERGGGMEQRDAAVRRFFASGILDESNNLQFGEGGAGAYSDGKLVTRIGDARCSLVLDLLAEHGAPRDSLMLAKPHVGTDLLKGIVVSIREKIISLGGTVRFNAPVTDLVCADGRLQGVRLSGEEIGCETAVLAIGHSARDMYTVLLKQGVNLQRKGFSVGVRAEHLQQDIDRALYGKYAGKEGLPPGEYSVAHRENGRGCYSFCMCPGGQVVAAASEQGGVVTNGMSFHSRDGENANAALCVSVNPDDFAGSDPLAGMAWQRELETWAFELGGGQFQAPVQTLGGFMDKRVSSALGRVKPTYPRGWEMRDLNIIMPSFVSDALRTAIPHFAQKLHGFDMPDTVLTGMETRTSAPVRIVRGEDMQSSVSGIIPCGEGAGTRAGL